MSWFTKFLASSVGKKLVMSLTGIFLIIFLIIHLAGNLQLLYDDGGKSFNLYAKFMTHNPLIQTVSILLYASIALHAIQGFILWSQNRSARGGSYAVKTNRVMGADRFSSVRMGWLGTVILVFILVHMYQFWLQMKLDYLPYVTIEGQEVKNLYAPVKAAFSQPVFVIFYVFSMLVIASHLNHGFQSSFQTLGINHKKYTPVIKAIGKLYVILIPLGFAIIPIIMYGQVNNWW